MAVEAKRGCGYRKVGGLYLVADSGGMPCCKMPLALNVCPCCGGGIKQARGWTWIDAGKMFGGTQCTIADTLPSCPAADPANLGKVGLIWIGESFYPTPADFMREAATMGVSRRLSAVPRNFKAGETWVMFAHPKAIQKPRNVERVDAADVPTWRLMANGEPIDGETFDDQADALTRAATLDLSDPIYGPGVIRITRPRGFEKIVKQSDYDRALADRETWLARANTEDPSVKSALLEQFDKDSARGVTWVPVPDNDPDHQGTVYDNEDSPLDERKAAS